MQYSWIVKEIGYNHHQNMNLFQQKVNNIYINDEKKKKKELFLHILIFINFFFFFFFFFFFLFFIIDCSMNIDSFINMTMNTKSDQYGTVYTLKEFIETFMNK